MPIERRVPSPRDAMRVRANGANMPKGRTPEPRTLRLVEFHQMGSGAVKRALQHEPTLAGLVEGAVNSGGQKDFGGGVTVQVFQENRENPVARITHTYKNWFGMTRKREMLVDPAGHKIA